LKCLRFSIHDKVGYSCDHLKAVYSTFPSLTFVNHYAIITGLHGGHHGIVHNVIFDPSMDPEPKYLGTTKRDGYYRKETIWSYYKRHHRKKVAVHSWIGSEHNSTCECSFCSKFQKMEPLQAKPKNCHLRIPATLSWK
ncbi:hypothetical protein ANCCAN_19136, partial [Ancylostoma caninum]